MNLASQDGEAKFRLEPEIELATAYGLTSKKLRTVRKLIEEHYDELIDAWDRHFRT